MSKDLEEGEIEEGELPEEFSKDSIADDEPGQVPEAGKADPATAEADPPLEPEPAKAPADSALTASVAPPDLSLLGLPSYDAPVHSYGSSMAFSAYGSAPYGASVPAQLLDRRHGHIRELGHAPTSYDSPRFAQRTSGASFTSRRSDPRGYSPSYSQDRYADQYDDSSSFDSRQGNSLAADDESTDEGELRPVNRSLSSRAQNRGPARDVKSISASIKSLASTANVPAAMKSFETVSLDLMDALADLEELQEALSGSTAVKADDNAQLADMAAKFFKGLSVIHLVCNTGVGKTSNLTAAGKLVRAAIAHQDTLLTVAHRKELNGWTKSSKVFKALADGQEESVQPKKPKAEAQPRTPYIPKQTKVSGQKRQASGQKQQGKGNQQGPKGKKQKKSSSAEAAVEADAEEAPPLPPPDSLSAYDSSQTMVEAGMEDDDSLPVPPLPPPSPDSPTVPAAVFDGNSSNPQQSAAGPLAPALEPRSRHSTLLPPEAPSAPQGRTQFGFKLQASKRQKLKMTEAEEPITHAMRERLERHLALQQQLQQQQQKEQQQQQQQLPQQVPQLQLGAQLQGRHELQAPAGSLPLPGPPPGLVLPPPGTHQLPYAAMPSTVHAATVEPVNGLPVNARHSRNAQSPSDIEEQRHASQKQHKHPRQHVADASGPLLPSLEPDLHQRQQQLPQQLHQAEPELPPGLAPEVDQSSQQSPQQLQRRLSHRHVHHRRSRHLHRTDTTDQEPPQQHAQPVLLARDALPSSQSEHQQSGFGPGALPEQLTTHQGVTYSAQQLSSQDAQPAHELPAQMPDQHQAGVQNGPQNGLGDLAESGGPVAVASGLAGAPAEVQVLADDVKSLLRQRKLCLVLDLDHTLINSARFSEVDPEHEAMLRSHQANEALRLPEERRELFRLDRIQMWTKLRPAVRQFLETAHEHFELWIHTNGNRSYAAAIVELLDPSGRLFGQRIISQGAAGDGVQQDLTKRLMQGLEGREPIALVVDDTSSVWGNHEENLVAVERYIYFPASRRQFGSKSKALLELRRDETPQSGMLMTALSVLLRTHRRTFRVLQESGGIESAGYQSGVRPPWDVRQVLQQERKQVLAGVHIMFSRVIPLQEGRPEQHPMWRKAIKFGATCTTQPSDAVTHVAAYVNGTEKVYWAQRTGKYVVTPEWLNCSAMLWKRAAEDAFPVIATA